MIIQYMKGEVREKVLIFIWRVISHAKLILNVVYKLNFYIIKECDNYTITNWRVSLSKICHEWPNNTVTHEWVTTLFGHEWHIFDNETRQLVLVFII